MSRGPIRAAYEQTGAIRRVCPMCDAGPGQWCIDQRGRLRRVPCVLRTRGTQLASTPTTTAAVDFSEPRRPQTAPEVPR